MGAPEFDSPYEYQPVFYMNWYNIETQRPFTIKVSMETPVLNYFFKDVRIDISIHGEMTRRMRELRGR